MTINIRYNIQTPVIDLRVLAKPIPDKHRLVRGAVVQRDPSDVIGIGLHQTAVVFGVGPQRVKDAAAIWAKHGSLWPPVATEVRRVAKDLRALEVAAHVTVFLEPPGAPRIVLALPFKWFVNHGNGLNPFTVGIEVEGKFPKFVPHGSTKAALSMHHPLTDIQIQAIRDALKVVVCVAREEGMQIDKIWGHCQSNGGKPSDPGEAIWRAGVETYGKTIGLEPEYDRTFKASNPKSKDGVKIPKEWYR